MPETRGYAAFDPKSPLRPFSFERREPGPRDVEIDVLYCGICHSDLHQVRDEWGGSRYPMVPGHEIIGRASRVGAEVEKVKEGDIVGVGCMVDSCRTCGACEEGLVQYCLEGFVPTYNGTERDKKTPTQGGYSTRIMVGERFVLRVRERARLEAVAPLLCAGIITADVELIAAPEIDRAYERMLRGDVRYRFVIDAKSFAAP